MRSAATGVGAVVLAAGRSARMRGGNKLLELLDGAPLIAHVVRAAVAAGAEPVVVVTGHEADRVAEVLTGMPVELVHNSRWQEGMSTSLRAGVDALAGRVRGALICLGDMPRVRADDMRALIRELEGAPPEARVAAYVPVHEGHRGNPVLWTAACFSELRSLSGDRGARGLLEQLGARVVLVAAGEGVRLDADTPEAVDRLRGGASLSPASTPGEDP